MALLSKKLDSMTLTIEALESGYSLRRSLKVSTEVAMPRLFLLRPVPWRWAPGLPLPTKVLTQRDCPSRRSPKHAEVPVVRERSDMLRPLASPAPNLWLAPLREALEGLRDVTSLKAGVPPQSGTPGV